MAYVWIVLGFMAGQPYPPPNEPPLRNKGLIAGLIKGQQMVNKPSLRIQDCPKKGTTPTFLRMGLEPSILGRGLHS